MRVLVADDQELVRMVISHVLSLAGHEVVAAVGDGVRTKVEAERLQPDVIVLDLSMPDLDGIEALRGIKQRHPHIRVVVHTGYNDEELTRELLAAGAEAVVTKSEDPGALLAAVAGTFPPPGA